MRLIGIAKKNRIIQYIPSTNLFCTSWIIANNKISIVSKNVVNSKYIAIIPNNSKQID